MAFLERDEYFDRIKEVIGDRTDETALQFLDDWAQWNTECQFPESHDKLVMWQYGGETNYIRNAYVEGVGVVDQNIMYSNMSINPDYYWTIAEPGGDDNETDKKVNKIIDLLHKVGQKLTEL